MIELDPTHDSEGSTNIEGEKSARHFRSLKELLDFASGKDLAKSMDQMGDSGLAEPLPFPFLALVGQNEMKLSLMLGLINPNIGGILLVGPRGTGKTTAVRSLLDLLPQTERSACYYRSHGSPTRVEFLCLSQPGKGHRLRRRCVPIRSAGILVQPGPAPWDSRFGADKYQTVYLSLLRM